MKKIFAFVMALGLFSSSAMASNYYNYYYGYKRTYEVTITNITKGQTFTPQLVATHVSQLSLFSTGEAASDELAILAEGGNTAPLTDLLQGLGDKVGDVQTIGGLLEPGKTTSITVEATPRQQFISVAAMLIPTNDTFMSINRVRLPHRGQKTYTALAYDAGSEFNDQNCKNIPGPRCGGEGVSAEPQAGDEGYVYISNGFHDLGEYDEQGNEILKPFVYDWRNPVARITVKRVR